MTGTDSHTISAIVPCFKQAHLLAGAIKSLLDQTYPVHEIIVIDDGSPDDVAAAAGSFGDLARCIRQENTGLAGARNTGIRNAAGQFLLFLDADDRLAPTAMQHHIAALGKIPTADVLVSGWQEVDPDGTIRLRHAAPDYLPDPFHALLPINRAAVHCHLVRAEVFRQVGMFETALAAHEDWDLWLRIAAAGFHFAQSEGDDAIYVQHPASLSRNSSAMMLSACQVVAKHCRTHHYCDLCQSARREAFTRLAERITRCLLTRTAGKKDLFAAVELMRPVDPQFWRRISDASLRLTLGTVKNGRALGWIKWLAANDAAQPR